MFSHDKAKSDFAIVSVYKLILIYNSNPKRFVIKKSQVRVLFGALRKLTAIIGDKVFSINFLFPVFEI